jgi:HlyD family secretion protein
MATSIRSHRWILRFLGITIFLSGVIVGCGERGRSNESARTDLLIARTERQDVIVEVSATGVIEPIRIVEIKSKASGEIIRMPVETGDVVSRGDVLVQVDTIEVATNLRQRTADLATRHAEQQIAERQLTRAEELFQAGMISRDELDRAVLQATTSRSNVIRAETELERAREWRRDTIVRSPISGTILSKNVEEGQIIASATSQVSGGTTLLKMADLSRVQVRALVDETEIGKVRSGQRATVKVDAFPGRIFTGDILKVEPEGRVERDITFFPVLIHIDNSEGLLRPGMNTTVDVHIDRRNAAIALTNDAVTTIPQALQIAPMLGIDPEKIRSLASIESAPAARTSERSPRPEGRRGERPMRSEWERPDRTAVAPQTQRGQAVVFVADSAGFRPLVVSTGIQNWNVTEITSGLSEGDEVIIPPSPLIAQQFEQFRERIRRWSALPGQR